MASDLDRTGAAGDTGGRHGGGRAAFLRRADHLDQRAFRAVAGHRSPALDVALRPLSLGGDDAVIWCTVAVGLALREGACRRASGRAIGSMAAASVLTNVVLKRAAGRRRPDLSGAVGAALLAEAPRSTSFPSGHAASAAAFATGAARELGWAGAPFVALAAAICYGRVYAGAHYPGDVLAGVTIGLLAAATSDAWWPRTALAALDGWMRQCGIAANGRRACAT